MFVLNQSQTKMVSGGDANPNLGDAASAAGVGGTLGAVNGIAQAGVGVGTDALASVAGVGTAVGAGIGLAAYAGWEIGSAINDAYGTQIGDAIDSAAGFLQSF